MELYEMVKTVTSREDLVKFLFYLRMEFKDNGKDWENPSLESYLEAMEAWITDMDGIYLNQNKPLPQQPSWKMIAEILYAASLYE